MRLTQVMQTAVCVAAAIVLLPAQPARADDGESATPHDEEPAAPAKTPDFEPVPDRWRIQPPGHWYDPYNQNVLKGDYPVIGQDIFLKLTGISRTDLEGRSTPTASGASADRSGSFTFFGNDNALIFDQKFAGKIEIQKGATAFKPFDWQVVIEGVIDVNHLGVFENGVVSPDVVNGTTRTTNGAALQEAAAEFHLMDLSANYDSVSAKLGRQPFNSDFRSLIFSDVNQGARLFGSANGNRYQYNLLYFNQAEKDTNSGLNTFNVRDQQIVIANLYIQDFFSLGYQNQFSVHYDRDCGTCSGFVFDNQGFLVRPDPVGIAKPHNLDIVYLGWTSEGHLGALNVSHAVYEAVGHDTNNPIAGQAVDINGQLAFLELSLDRDWMRYQASAFFSSGDDNPRDGTARGFDSILDAPKILGGDFGYWNRQSIRITDRGGIGLMQANSIIPDLRSSKIQGQANFVNPGLAMFNLGATAAVTPTLTALANANYIRFVTTAPLELLLKQANIGEDVGVDLSLGVEYRPLLNNNIILKGFGAILQPVGGFTDIFPSTTLYQVGTEMALAF